MTKASINKSTATKGIDFQRICSKGAVNKNSRETAYDNPNSGKQSGRVMTIISICFDAAWLAKKEVNELKVPNPKLIQPKMGIHQGDHPFCSGARTFNTKHSNRPKTQSNMVK